VGLAAAAWVASMLPDVDLPGARVHRRTRLERRHLAVRSAGRLARIPLWLAARLEHRGITHSIAACAAVIWLAALISRDAAIGAALGYGAHVAADACTPAGVRAFAPVSRRPVHLLPKCARIPTGSARELLFGLAFAAACAVVTLP
jgi:membrane-bound metal-dependent hydrolase YbcI (DUF457 family)